MSASTIPAVLDALTALWTAALPDTFQVQQGKLLNVEPDYLIVGHSEDVETPAVSGERNIADFALGSDSETYDIENLLATWLGGEDTLPDARDRVFGFLDLMDDALDGSPKLGVTGVAVARITDFALNQPLQGEGPMLSLRFTVHIEAWK